MTEPVRIFSLGHGARPLAELIDTLQGAGIQRVVDVRTAPGSRRHPHFGRDSLAEALPAAGVEYVWRKDLGGFRRSVTGSPHTALRSDAFRGYADHMETGEFRTSLEWLIEGGREDPTAFMCAEALWWRCHRRMIADALTAREVEVVHLIRPGERQPHRLHPAARIDGTRMIYDRAQPEQGALLEA